MLNWSFKNAYLSSALGFTIFGYCDFVEPYANCSFLEFACDYDIEALSQALRYMHGTSLATAVESQLYRVLMPGFVWEKKLVNG